MRKPSLWVGVFTGAVLGAWCLAVPAAGPNNPSGDHPPATQSVPWDTFSDTWVATDALGRSLPAHAEVGSPRPGKFVGIFYFLWLGQHGDAGPFDISKILASDPLAMSNPSSPLWGPLHVPHHWGESIFGYYVADDEGVLAKHAQMLADADVDVVIFDVTNQLTYPRSYLALCRVWQRIRQRGGRTPQLTFLCPFWSPRKVLSELYNDFYGRNLYPDLWFRWEGRPLILADPAVLNETFGNDQHDTPVPLAAAQVLGQSLVADHPVESVGGCFPTWKTANATLTLALRRGGPDGDVLARERFESVSDNSWLSLTFTNPLPAGSYFLEASEPAGQIGWWSHSRDVFPRGQAFVGGNPVAGDRTLRIKSSGGSNQPPATFFTFRKPQPDYFTGPRGPGEWGWLEVHPQHAFYRTPGVPEEVTVGVAQNAVDGRLSVLSNPRSHGRSFHRGRQPGPAGQDFAGRNFAEQWQRALDLDPAFIFITGWNEWIAGRFTTNSGFHADGPVTFVDQFSREYSRDIEPMKGGHGDSFYYQMVGQIRRFKGVRPLPPIRSQPIRIDGQFNDWDSVAPEFRDQIADPVQRDHSGWGRAGRYVNKTGRNDIIAAKVGADDRSIFFYARARESLTPSTDPNWMLLFLDTDQNPTNGWLGYDFVVNRSDVRSTSTTVERYVGGGARWGAPVTIECRTAGAQIELAIPRSVLAPARPLAAVDFKWADNLPSAAEAADLTLNGDAAPNDRFSYRAVLSP